MAGSAGRRTAPSIDWLEKLADALDEPWSLLVPEDSSKPATPPKKAKRRKKRD